VEENSRTLTLGMFDVLGLQMSEDLHHFGHVTKMGSLQELLQLSPLL